MNLYALIDRDSLDKSTISITQLITQINKFNTPLLQYRAKNSTTQDRIKTLKIIRKLYNGKIIINDDINAIDYCDGLHIGQDDILKYDTNYSKAIKIIRDKIGNKLLGLSTHNIDEILEANSLDLDYIGLGAYRTTNTKKDAPLGDNLIEVAKKSKHKVALIGGVRLDDKFDENIIYYNVVGSDLYKGVE
ncbi:Thiamin-phosphate pyrophosphorylase [hydrothermal vent metagenome]|uniref:Thiamin-phosphate pyrophosphorylase n=1 Tax=hydrothermal vent metagenome TaxID=652676 RepID=A0A1W1EIX5_9ZZZZ